LGFSGKKARKILNKANTQKRTEFLAELQSLFNQALHNEHLLIYIDEAHIHLDIIDGKIFLGQNTRTA